MLSVEGHTVNMFDFAGHKVIFVIVTKAARDNMQMTGMAEGYQTSSTDTEGGISSDFHMSQSLLMFFFQLFTV